MLFLRGYQGEYGWYPLAIREVWGGLIGNRNKALQIEKNNILPIGSVGVIC
ncbi:MAG: hypothetical protein K0S54_3006 [Alphaproteobacteria bacterium]|nr:hypothetical protein [Alphaproteobacteria bacterium]